METQFTEELSSVLGKCFMSLDFFSLIIVSDEAGNPVAGATVQFCSDITCMAGKTDAEGITSFAAEQGPYTVHVQKVPEGYEPCTEEFAVPDDLADVKITLKKA